MRLRPADLAAIAEFNAGVMRSRAEYQAHPSAGRYDDNRQQPCFTCAAPTYSQAGQCADCNKGER